MIASLEEHHPGIEFVHFLAVPDNFKGFHDAVGKDPARKIKELEKIGIRLSTAFKVFVNCDQHLTRTEDDTNWARYERNCDPRLKQKRTYGMDSRTVWFVAEKKEEQDRLSALGYRGRILLCDRSFILDTHGKKAIKDTRCLHKIRKCDKVVPTEHPFCGR